MSRALRGLVSLVVAAGLATGSAVFATQWLHDDREEKVAAQAEPLRAEHRVDRVVNALAGVADDGVYVAPDARDMLGAKGERQVARAIARSQTPVKVVVWTTTSFAGASRTDLRHQLEAALAELDERGVYLIWEGPESGTLDTYGQHGYVSSISVHDDFAGDPATTIPQLVGRIDASVSWTDPDSSDSDYWGGTGGGIAAGALMGTGVLLVIGGAYGLVVLVTKRRLPGTWRW